MSRTLLKGIDAQPSPRVEPARLTGTYVRLDAQVAALVREQQGVVTLAQLTALGLTASAVHKRAARKRLHRVHPRVYSIAPPVLLSAKGRYMAAALACEPDAVLSHRSAADLHGLRRTEREGIDVTVRGRRRPTVKGVDVHCSTTLTEADTTLVDRIPCTTVARTLLDLACVVPRRQVERAFDQAGVLENLDGRQLDDVLERNRNTRGARALNAILAEYKSGPPTESELEERLLAICRDAGLPLPERQVYIDPGDGEPMVRADFAWREQRLIVEADGARFHGTRRAFESDRRRDQRLLLAGWRVIRVTWRQLTEEPRRIARLLAAALRQG